MDGNAVWFANPPIHSTGSVHLLCTATIHVFYRLGASRSHAVPVSWFIYVDTIMRNILQIGFVKTSYCLHILRTSPIYLARYNNNISRINETSASWWLL